MFTLTLDGTATASKAAVRRTTTLELRTVNRDKFNVAVRQD